MVIPALASFPAGMTRPDTYGRWIPAKAVARHSMGQVLIARWDEIYSHLEHLWDVAVKALVRFKET